MAGKEVVDTKAIKGGPYSHGIKAGPFLFVSGHVADRDPATGKALSSDIAAQTKQALNNLKKVVEAAGSTVADIVKTTVFMVNIGDFSKMNAAYEEFFKEHGVSKKFPARSTVGIAGLAAADLVIEIECIAML